EITRTIFPSTDKAAIIEKIEIKNNSSESVDLKIDNQFPTYQTDSSKGVYGSYIVGAVAENLQKTTIAPQSVFHYQLIFYGKKTTEQKYAYHAVFELERRRQYLDGLNQHLILKTP